jgi:raffinose/stachyose/melibiose transport system substrate-binding protein
MTSAFERRLREGRLSRAQFLRMVGGLAVAGAAPAALAACGSGSSGGGSADKAQLSLIGVADEKPPLDDLTKAYTSGKPGVTFKTSYAPTDQVQTSLRAQLGAGNAPDVHVVYPGDGSAMSMTQIAKANLLADLSDQSWTSLIPGNFKPAFQYQGKTYMYSAGASVIGAIYNKSVFQQAGASIPTTWPELLAVCEKIKGAGKVPIALGAQTPWVTQLITYALVPSTVYADNPDFDDQQAAGKTSFAQSGWRKAFQMYLDLQAKGYFNDNVNGTTYEQATSMVATGKAAMAVQVSAVLPAFRDAATNKDDLSMFPFPGADTADKVWIPAGVVVGVGAHARGKNLSAAKAFIEFLGKQENINAWAKSIAAIPLHQDASSTIDPALTSLVPFVKANKAVPFMDQRWPNAEVQPTHFAVVQDLLAKKIDIDGALKKMDEAYGKKS